MSAVGERDLATTLEQPEDGDHDPAAEEPRRKLWTVEEFHRLARAGFFADDSRVELIEGEIYEMSPMHPPHANAVRRVRHALLRVF